MTLPNFLVIGTPRSGTTSLYEWLQQHPDVFMSPYKEPHFFGCSEEEKTCSRPLGMEFVSDFDEYTALFETWSGQRAIGEASPCYLSRPDAPTHIKQILPDAKMIVVFRNPVERAFSHYTLFRSQGLERDPDFMNALREEQAGKRRGTDQDWNYLGLGFYARQLREFQQHFSGSQVKVFLFEELTKNSPKTLAEICRFLEIDSTFSFDTSTAYNAMHVPRSDAVAKVLYTEAAWKTAAKRVLTPRFVSIVGRRLERWNQIKPQKLSAQARQFLQDLYREDILELQTLIGRDLSHWLIPQSDGSPTKQEARPPVTASVSPAHKQLSPQPSKPSDG